MPENGVNIMKQVLLLALVGALMPILVQASDNFPQPGMSYGGKLRSGPGMNYNQIGSLQENEDLSILGRTGVQMNGYEWFAIALTNGKTGYQWGGIMCSQHGLPGVFGQCAALQRNGGTQEPATSGRFGAAKGFNVAQVRFDGGMFTWQGQDHWIEGSADGQPRFHFRQTGRDEWSVYLIDDSRDVRIQLDLHRGMILYGQGNSEMSDLYTITSAAAGH